MAQTHRGVFRKAEGHDAFTRVEMLSEGKRLYGETSETTDWEVACLRGAE